MNLLCDKPSGIHLEVLLKSTTMKAYCYVVLERGQEPYLIFTKAGLGMLGKRKASTRVMKVQIGRQGLHWAQAAERVKHFWLITHRHQLLDYKRARELPVRLWPKEMRDLVKADIAERRAEGVLLAEQYL